MQKLGKTIWSPFLVSGDCSIDLADLDSLDEFRAQWMSEIEQRAHRQAFAELPLFDYLTYEYPRSSPSSAAKAFAIANVVEQVSRTLGPTDILRLSAVKRIVREVCDNSPDIQRAAYLYPEWRTERLFGNDKEEAEALSRPLDMTDLLSNTSGFIVTPNPSLFTIGAQGILTDVDVSRLSRTSSCNRIQITRPPTFATTVEDQPIFNSRGITFGEVRDAALHPSLTGKLTVTFPQGYGFDPINNKMLDFGKTVTLGRYHQFSRLVNLKADVKKKVLEELSQQDRAILRMMSKCWKPTMQAWRL